MGIRKSKKKESGIKIFPVINKQNSDFHPCEKVLDTGILRRISIYVPGIMILSETLSTFQFIPDHIRWAIVQYQQSGLLSDEMLESLLSQCNSSDKYLEHIHAEYAPLIQNHLQEVHKAIRIASMDEEHEARSQELNNVEAQLSQKLFSSET